MHKPRFPRMILFLTVFAAAFVALSATKRPLNHRDYDHWKTITSETLSRDGKYLAYSLFPEEGDGEIVVRNLATGKEVHEPAGAVPEAPADAGAEEPPAAGPAARGVRLAFTFDNHYLVSSTFPAKGDVEQAKKDKKPAPKGGMVIVDLATSKVTRVADVASFQVAAKGDSYLAYLKEAPPAATPATAAAEKDDESGEDQRRAGGGRGGAGGAGARKFGADLVLRDLRVGEGKDRTFADVTEFSLSKDAKALLYNVSSKKEESNGLYVVDPAKDAAATALLSGKGRYTKLTWDREQKQLVFFSDKDDAASKPAKFKLYEWTRGSAAPVELISASTPHFKSGFVLADRGPVSFSRDGSKVFVSCAPPSADPADTPAAPADTSDKVLADLWRWNDDYIQPMQKVRLAQERNRTYRAVYTIATKDFKQLSDETMNTLTPSDSGAYAVGADDRSYRRMVDFDGNYSDLYIVDTATGNRKLALKAFKGGGGGGGGAAFSPDGKHLLWYKDKNWWSVSVPDGAPVNLTGNVNTKFFNEEHDTPDAPASFGNAGWTKDGKHVLLYDRNDVWMASPDSQNVERLTNGGAAHLQFRVVQFDRGDEEEDRGIDPAKPLLLRAENLETRDTGFFSLPKVEKGLTAKKLVTGAKAYRAISKAQDADVVLMTEMTFHEQPDLFVTDSNFDAPKKVTNANPQQAELLWGTSEMISYRNDDGVQLQGVLYKPEGFDPKKKYPMIIYIYERLSQNLNTFVPPRPGHSINISYYVSNGYLVLTPDIVYTTGHPGQSALKCVLPAIEAMVEKGFVDRAHIGFQGHSWGGYQGAYLLTQTNIFAAAETGAPVANMISAYDGIRWGPGLPRQFQYEKTQSRIGGTLWEKPMQFIENSPIFNLDRVTTPVMIIANDADDAVPWYQGIEMFLGLRRLGKEAYLFNYNGEPHHLNRRPNQKDYTMRMQQFFDHYLKGGPTPEWMEKGVSYMDREKEKERFANSVSEGADHKQ